MDSLSTRRAISPRSIGRPPRPRRPPAPRAGCTFPRACARSAPSPASTASRSRIVPSVSARAASARTTAASVGCPARRSRRSRQIPPAGRAPPPARAACTPPRSPAARAAVRLRRIVAVVRLQHVPLSPLVSPPEPAGSRHVFSAAHGLYALQEQLHGLVRLGFAAGRTKSLRRARIIELVPTRRTVRIPVLVLDPAAGLSAPAAFAACPRPPDGLSAAAWHSAQTRGRSFSRISLWSLSPANSCVRMGNPISSSQYL